MGLAEGDDSFCGVCDPDPLSLGGNFKVNGIGIAYSGLVICKRLAIGERDNWTSCSCVKGELAIEVTSELNESKHGDNGLLFFIGDEDRALGDGERRHSLASSSADFILRRVVILPFYLEK